MFIIFHGSSHFSSSHREVFLSRWITWISRTTSWLVWWLTVENINKFRWSFTVWHLIDFFLESQVMSWTNSGKFERFIIYSLIDWRSMKSSDVLSLQWKLDFSFMRWTLIQWPRLSLIVFETITLSCFDVDQPYRNFSIPWSHDRQKRNLNKINSYLSLFE